MPPGVDAHSGQPLFTVPMGPLSMEAPVNLFRVLCTVEEDDETSSEEEEEEEVSVESPTRFEDMVPFAELEDFGDDPSSICSLHLVLLWSDPQSDWVLKKVRDSTLCRYLLCCFEDQLTALFTAIAVGQSHSH